MSLYPHISNLELNRDRGNKKVSIPPPEEFVESGYGEESTGGEGGDTYVVTSLEDTLPNGIAGEFRFAMLQLGARIIEFNVEGWIRLKEKLVITEGSFTIAGNTANGKGVGVCYDASASHLDTNGSMIELSGLSNFIIHNMRFYATNDHLNTGDLDLSEAAEEDVPFMETNALGVVNCSTGLIYSNQFGGGSNSQIEISSNSLNITIQQNLIHRALSISTHSDSYVWNGLLWVATAISRGAACLITGGATNISFIGNLILDCGGRLPRVASTIVNFEYLGNMILNMEDDQPEFIPSTSGNFNVVGNWSSQNGVNTNRLVGGKPSYICAFNPNATFYGANNRTQRLLTDTTIGWVVDRINILGATDNLVEISLHTDTGTGFEIMDTTAKLMARANNVGVAFNGRDSFLVDALGYLESVAELLIVGPLIPLRFVNDLLFSDLPSLN